MMYVLSGFLSVTENETGFLIPYFYLYGSNYTYVQDVGSGYLVSSFKVADSEGFFEVKYTPQRMDLREGMPAILAFRKDGEVVYGDIDYIRGLSLENFISDGRPIFNASLSMLFLNKNRHDIFVKESSKYFGKFSDIWAGCEYLGYDIYRIFQEVPKSQNLKENGNKYQDFLKNPESPTWAQDWFIRYIYDKGNIDLLDIGMWWLSSYIFGDDNRKSSPALVFYALIDVKAFRSEIYLLFDSWFSKSISYDSYKSLNLDLFGGVSRQYNKMDVTLTVVWAMFERGILYSEVRGNRSLHFDLCALMTRNERSLLSIDLINRIGVLSAEAFRIVSNYSDNPRWMSLSRGSIRSLISNTKVIDRNWCDVCAIYIKNFPDDENVSSLALAHMNAFFLKAAVGEKLVSAAGVISASGVVGWFLLWEALYSIHRLRSFAHAIGCQILFSRDIGRHYNFYVKYWPRVFLIMTEILDESEDYGPYIDAANEWIRKNSGKLKSDWKYKKLDARIKEIFLFQKAVQFSG